MENSGSDPTGFRLGAGVFPKLLVKSEMASNKVTIVPTVDFSKPGLRQGTAQWESTKAQVFDALKEYGCFEAIYDKVPNEIQEAMFDALKETLPLENKLRDYIAKPFARYEGQIPRLPFYEHMHSADLLLPESVETFANTFWPDGNLDFCNMVNSYTKPLVELGETVEMMVLESLGLIDYIDQLLHPDFSFLRFTHYKAVQGGDENAALGPHTDGCFLTIIKQNQVGLQVLKKNGEWIEFNVSPNSYIVLSADAFLAWTNGRVQSATHRVVTKEGDTDRLSMQLFLPPKPGYTLEAPKELVDDEHPLLFKPYDIAGYYEYVLSGAKAGVGLKAYCGV